MGLPKNPAWLRETRRMDLDRVGQDSAREHEGGSNLSTKT